MIHMAYSNSEFENLAKQVDVNIKGSVNVLDACVSHRIPRIVFASTVMTVCVDINPAVVTKLADRGSAQTVGVVTDVGLFVKLLADRIAD